MQTTTNRRGALVSLAKAAAATTALSVACGVSQCSTKANAATIDRSTWDRAYAKWKVTEAEWDQLADAVMGDDGDFGDEAGWARLKARIPHFQAARDDFMQVPAPDQAALLVKLEIWAESLGSDHAEATIADARRLLGGRA
jgi:hypothetical protein